MDKCSRACNREADVLFSAVELKRVSEIYQKRNYDHDQAYSDTNLVYLHRTQSVERATITAMGKLGLLTQLQTFKILDFGCGNGRWLSRWLTWGAVPENMAAADVRKSALMCAKALIPQADIRLITESGVDFPDNTFDIVYQNVVFSSILDDTYRHNAAKQIIATLKPGGRFFWYDFIFNNPRNHEVRKVEYRDIQKFFPNFTVEYVQKIVLAPPLAKRVVPFSWFMADTLNALPFLRTHLFAVLRKPLSVDVGMGVHIREAGLLDIEQMITVHMAAFVGFPLTLLGRRFLRVMYSSFISYSEGICVVAEHDGKILGFAAGTAQPRRYLRKILLRRGLAFLFSLFPVCLQHPKIITSRILMAMSYSGEKPDYVPDESSVLLSSMAVHPDSEKQGVGAKLVQSFCDLASQREATSIYLITDSQHNDAVNRFYLRQNFILMSRIIRSSEHLMNLYQRDLN